MKEYDMTQKNNILIVEHDALMRDFLCELLSPQYHVETTTNAREALSKLLCERCDVALIDQDLPEIDGDQLAYKIKQLGLSVVSILMTDDPIDLTQSSDLGCDISLLKPFFDPERIERAIKWALKMHSFRVKPVLT